MSMDFSALNIKVDPGNALITLEQAAQKFRAAEVQAQMTQAAFGQLTSAFRSMAQAMRQEQAALARIPLTNLATGFGRLGEMMGRVASVSDRLARANDPLARSFGGVAQAMQREQQILERINGPAREYMEQLQALDSLLGRETISTDQYAKQVRRLNQELEHGNAVATQSEKHKGGLFSGFSEEATLALKAYAGFEGVRELGHITDEYTLISNKLRVLTTDQASFNALLHQTLDIADTTRVSWEATVTTYQRLRVATRELGLGEKQVLDLTKEMSEASKISGASSQDAQMALMELSHAFSQGSLMGQSFKVLMRDVPGMLHELQVASGMSQTGFEKLGLSGKITGEMLVEWFDKAKVSISDKFAATMPSISEQFTTLKNDVTDAVGEFEDGTGALELFGTALSGVVGIAETALAPIGAVIELLRTLKGLTNDKSWTDFWTRFGGGGSLVDTRIRLEQDLKKQGIDTSKANTSTGAKEFLHGLSGFSGLYDLNEQLGQTKKKADAIVETHLGEHVAEGLGKILPTMEKVQQGLYGVVGTLTSKGIRGLIDPWYAGTLAVEKHHHALTSEEQLLKSIDAPMTRANELIRDSALLYARGAITVQQWGEQVRKAQALAGTAPPVRSIVSGEGGDHFTPFRYEQQTPNLAHGGLFALPAANMNEVSSDKLGAITAKQQAEAYQDALAQAAIAYDGFESRARDAISGIDSGWKQILHDATDSAAHIKGAMTDAFSTIQDSLTSMVLKGKFDLGSLASSLEQIAVRLAVQEATGGLLGLIGGGMTGFDYLTPGGTGRLALPGFARGGDVMVGGSGAPDSKVAMFRVSPGESISVRTPQQREAMAGAAMGGSHTVVNLNYDPRAIRQGRDIEDGVYAAIRRNPAAFRALLAG